MTDKNKKIKEHFKAHKKRYSIIGLILLFIVVFGSGATLSRFVFNKNNETETASVEQIKTEKNICIKFLLEVYDKIQENYWNKISDEELTNIYKLATEKLTQNPQTLNSPNKDGIEKMILPILENINEDQKKEFSAQLANLVLVNLKPFGRSALFTSEAEKKLKEKVENINPDTGKIESTVYTNLIRPKILHLYIKRMSPTTYNDLKTETEKFNAIDGLDTLILDLRGNIGGSLDILLYVLGPFIGQNQYAFDLFQQGEYTPLKTVTGWLPSLMQYKKVIILINEKSQSSAEVMASTLKKYNVGVLTGTKTKGWGTIEKIYEIENQIDLEKKISMFLVNHLTLRDDNQPIEENGVQPTININDENWKEQLFAYFRYNDLAKVVEEVWNTSTENFVK